MNDKIVIELLVSMMEGTCRVGKVRVYEDGERIISIVNDDRYKDLTHLNIYTGCALHIYFNGELECEGEFVSAGFNEDGITKISYFANSEVHPQ